MLVYNLVFSPMIHEKKTKMNKRNDERFKSLFFFPTGDLWFLFPQMKPFALAVHYNNFYGCL